MKPAARCVLLFLFFFQAEDGIRDWSVTGVQTCALPISRAGRDDRPFQTLRFKRAVIATGARAVEPPIPGLAEAGYLTNETVFNLTQCPARLAVIGGGPIGCELAQAFQRLGSKVSLFHKNTHLLDREDMEAAALVQSAFIREGVAVRLNAKITRVERNGAGNRIWYELQGKEETLDVDEILAGAGRAPNVQGL